MLKSCRECHEFLPLHAFSTHPHCLLGLNNRCRSCKSMHDRVARQLRKQHVKPDRCDTCFSEKPLMLDHCHETGQFRAWLCKACNCKASRPQERAQILLDFDH